MRTILYSLIGILWLSSLNATNYMTVDISPWESLGRGKTPASCAAGSSKSTYLGQEDITRHVWIKLTTLPKDETRMEKSLIQLTAYNTKEQIVGTHIYHIRKTHREQPVSLPLLWSMRDVYRVEIDYLQSNPSDFGCVLAAKID